MARFIKVKKLNVEVLVASDDALKSASALLSAFGMSKDVLSNAPKYEVSYINLDNVTYISEPVLIYPSKPELGTCMKVYFSKSDYICIETDESIFGKLV